MKDLYERDFDLWRQQQAALLRARTSKGLDWDNLAEEVDDLRKWQDQILRVQVMHIVKYLLILEVTQDTEFRRFVREHLAMARSELESVLDVSPSLRSEIPAVIEKETPRARRYALHSLADEGGRPETLRVQLYTEAEVITEWLAETA